jgi:hypothetical protein
MIVFEGVKPHTRECCSLTCGWSRAMTKDDKIAWKERSRGALP